MSTRGKGSDTFKDFLSYFYGNFIVLLLGFIQTPLLTRILSTDEYGRTGMFETAVTVIYIFAILGLDQSYIRYYYEPDIDRGALLRRCLTPAVIIVSILSVIYILFSGPANMFLFGEDGNDVVALVIIYTFISVFERFFFLDVRMQQNGRLYSNINIAEKVLSILTIIAAFYIMGNDFRIGLYALAVLDKAGKPFTKAVDALSGVERKLIDNKRLHSGLIQIMIPGQHRRRLAVPLHIAQIPEA